MKVFRISFGNESNVKNGNVLNPFFYTAQNTRDNKKSYLGKHKLEYLGGGLALIAVLVSLKAFKGNKIK